MFTNSCYFSSSYDYVEVKDDEVSYGKYCGNTLQGDDMVIDDTPHVYIVFHSDTTLTKTGFRMEFEHVNIGKHVCREIREGARRETKRHQHNGFNVLNIRWSVTLFWVWL